MTRPMKNIIATGLLVLLVGSSIFTVNLASSDVNSKTNNISDNVLIQNGNEGPPDMPNGDNNFNGGPPSMPNDNNDNVSGDMTPPDRPDGDNNRPTRPDMNGNNNSTDESSIDRRVPHARTGESKNSIDSNTEESSNVTEEDFTPPNMPDENNDNFNRPNGGMTTSNLPDQNSSNPTISTLYYVLFGIESLFIGLTLMYLIMSNFNKKSFKETFSSGDKIIIFVLATILITTGLTYLDSFLVTDVLSSGVVSSDISSNK